MSLDTSLDSTAALIKAFQENGCPKTRNSLVQLNMGLVRKEAHRWVHYSQETFEDLVQVGTLGLIRAVERFDPNHGSAFSTFAMVYIRGEIQHYLRDKSAHIRVPRRWQTLYRQGSRLTSELRQYLDRQPTNQEIATGLQIGVEEWEQIKFAYVNCLPLSLDAPVSEATEDSTSLGETLPDQHYRSFQLAQEDRIRLQQCLQKLEARTCEILEFVFLHDLSQKETAELLGISAVTVSRQVKKGLEHLRRLMVHEHEAGN
ncbi:RNA polymerase sigma factor SigF [Thermosynechococcaceae cyanobacterium BACA0444]|uniref:RNA polymerase sigma factor SigF n=1 Tax=Pseudocalidococcus azoricus BACA0444 TaxID=2918990 RepID=A0AAE4FTS1_9CYAN|nr:RNA polymerase sigma factor SigF [Pseudocalidococcus azoricus]MDS3862188.1 RNA polymerase sigma factor SigF [Pseudocalidococcus azoricus BACA0444]